MKLLTEYLDLGAIHFRNRIFDPGEVRMRIDAAAQYLAENLISDSPFIYLFASNHVKTVVAFFGIIKARRICVIVDPETGKLELNEMMRDAPPAACVKIDNETIEWDYSREFVFLPCACNAGDMEDLHDVCTMMYSAADDGYAKAVMLTHENMVRDSFAAIDAADVNGNSIICAVLPFCHLYGIQVGIIMPNLIGAEYIIEEKTNLIGLQQVVDKMVACKVTHVMSIPVFYYMLCKCAKEVARVPRLKNAISGGYKLPDSIGTAFLSEFGMPICEGYGLTEAGPSCTLNSVKSGWKSGSVGRPLSCCRVKVVNSSGTVHGAGEEGVILVSGTNVMKGYYKKPQASAVSIQNGWLFTGDRGYQDDEGFLYIVGTKKRMINYGGQKIYPAETERLLMKNDNIQYVRIICVENQLLGQTSQAEIELVDNTEMSRSRLKEWLLANITGYKIPKKIIVNKRDLLI